MNCALERPESSDSPIVRSTCETEERSTLPSSGTNSMGDMLGVGAVDG